MVVGAGIAGMQSALDLAESGFKVYLVEKTSSIGGRMAQLDKTFPTNDCAMCTISPRLIDVARHDNIEIITDAELTALAGGPGDFAANLHIQPRFVDIAKCNACGECVDVCPVRLPAEFEQGTTQRTAIHRRFPQAIPGQYAISKDGVSPCRINCPAGCNAHAYIAMVGQGRFDRAIGIIRQTLPLPGVLGRVCDHACEGGCHRGKFDHALAIRNIKRFAADWEADHAALGPHGLPLLDAEGREQVAGVTKKPQRVAIIGSGPAGLTAARDLVLEGYGVTIFEAQDKPGGMLRYGIPRYRLEEPVLARDVQSIVDLGVELRTGVRVLSSEFRIPNSELNSGTADPGENGQSRQLNSQFTIRNSQFSAVFVAVGAWTSRKLNVPGEDALGVWPGLKFLHEVNSGAQPAIGRTVVVIGGGDVAMDAARCARRLPGVQSVHLACLESREEMPAHKWEAVEAVEEGVIFHTSQGPTRIVVENGRAVGVEFRACARVFDGDGRFSPQFDDGCKTTLQADAVIVTIGQGIDGSTLGAIATGPGGRVAADPVTLATNVPGIFAGGDVVLGPASAVKAIAQGHRAAESIIRHLRGDDLTLGRALPTPDEAPEPIRAVERRQRRPMATIDMARRLTSFDAMETGYTEQDALAEAGRCLNCAGCCECQECVRACSPKGIDHKMLPRDRQLDVGAVVLAAGYEPFDPRSAGLYLFGQAPNVVTSLQFERMCSSSGPTGGELRRPSDGKQPRRIAWIQCVGSRDVTCDRDYCSGFCCMASIKEATMTRDHYADSQTTIFYNDIRAYGKGFEKYFTRAIEIHGVQFVKALPARISEQTRSGNLTVHFGLEDGTVQQQEFDLVVLAVGMAVSPAGRQLANVAGVSADAFGFCHADVLSPGRTSREGIFVAGTLEGPCDIPESVTGGSAAAALAMELLAGGRGSEITAKQFPPEQDVLGQAPRIGVFVCRCGTNIARVVDVPTLAQYAGTLPNVIHAEENLYTCSTDTQAKIITAIRDNQLNRVVVCSCTPRTHEPLFRQTLQQAGLNPYLFEMANIRDQCSWVHEPWHDRANEKARDLLRMAVSRAGSLEPIPQRTSPVTIEALIVGGGITGLSASLNLARQGFGVTLVERQANLGGQIVPRHGTGALSDAQTLLEQLLDEVSREKRIRVLLSSTVTSCQGHVGRFQSIIRDQGGAERTIDHGVVILATGGREYAGADFGWGTHPRVMSQRQLQDRLAEGKTPGGTVVMIQCVGSRDDKHPYCSRVCCTLAVKNALAIKAANPSAEIFVLHRGMRTYGLAELEYRQAREAGVIFVRFDQDAPPAVDASDAKPVVTFRDPALNYEFRLAAEAVVLSTGIEADPGTAELARAFKAPVDEDGFLLEAHIKLRPVDFANDGMFLAGLAHAPKTVGDCVRQALAASARSAAILSKSQLILSGYTASVDPEKCAACMTCARICPFNVPRLDEEKRAVTIDPASCHGCGSCAAACPVRAIEVGHYKASQIVAGIEGLRIEKNCEL